MICVMALTLQAQQVVVFESDYINAIDVDIDDGRDEVIDLIKIKKHH